MERVKQAETAGNAAVAVDQTEVSVLESVSGRTVPAGRPLLAKTSAWPGQEQVVLE